MCAYYDWFLFKSMYWSTLVGKRRKEELLASLYGVLEDMGVESLTWADRQNYIACDDRLCREKCHFS
jgi:hypothetical protein